MVNYQNGKIYRIDCLTTGKVYIGSTTKKTVAQRLAEHVNDFKKRKNGIRHLTSFQIIEQGNYKITLIELYPCNSKDELTSREGHYIRTMDCVNKVIPNRTRAEYYEETEQQRKEYYEERKEHILQTHQEWREKNPNYDTEYRELNRNRISERNKKPYTCPCGRTICINEKARHERSAFHLKNVSLI